MSLYGVQKASSKTDRQVIDKECFEDVRGNTRDQLIDLQSKTCHSQDTTSWNTFLWVEFVRECCRNSDSVSPVPDIFWHKNRQSASEANPVKVSDDAILPGCLIGFRQVTEETKLPSASEQRHPRDIFQDSPGGRWCYDVSWRHIGFCLVSRIFQYTRWSEYWSCILEHCIGSWSVQWVYSWVGQYGPCLVWGSGSLLLLSIDEGNPPRSKSYSGSLLGSAVCPRGDASTDCCGSCQVQVQGVWPSLLTAFQIDYPRRSRRGCWFEVPPFALDNLVACFRCVGTRLRVIKNSTIGPGLSMPGWGAA